MIDVRAGALPVVMVEAMPGSEAAAALQALTGRLDAGAVVRPLAEAESAALDDVIADMLDDADAMAMRGDGARADWARVYAGRLARAREAAREMRRPSSPLPPPPPPKPVKISGGRH